MAKVPTTMAKRSLSWPPDVAVVRDPTYKWPKLVDLTDDPR
jgi:hypothetical protein